MTDRLHTTDTELHTLWTITQAKRRAGTSSLKVPAEALEHLLKDHHAMVTALQSRKLIALGPDMESLGGSKSAA